MPQFKLMTSTGTTPPRYVHYSIEDAQKQAIRLCELHNCQVEILQIVGTVSKKQVPVTALKTVVEMMPGQSDDLPF